MNQKDRADELLQTIYQSWDVMYEDETGIYRLPTNRKAIELTKQHLPELEKLAVGNEQLASEVNEIKKILTNAETRTSKLNRTTLIATIVWLGFLFFFNGLHKSNDSMLEGRTDEQILRMKNNELRIAERNVAKYTAIIDAGYKAYGEGYDWTKKEKKEKWKRDKEFLKDNKKMVKDITPMSLKQYKKYTIKRTRDYKVKYQIMFVFYILGYIAYLYASRRPNFLSWKRGKASFGKLQDTVGDGVAFAAFTALMTEPFVTVERLHWSNGMVTTRMTNMGQNILIAGMILVLLFGFYIFVAMTVPYRAIINYVRNYVLYI